MREWFSKHKKTKALLIIVLANIIVRFVISGIFLLVETNPKLTEIFFSVASIFSIIITIYFGYLTYRITEKFRDSAIVALSYAGLIGIFDTFNYIEAIYDASKSTSGLISFCMNRLAEVFINYLMSFAVLIFLVAIGIVIASIIRIER